MTMLVTITCTACRVPFQLNFLLARQIGFNPFDSPWRGRTGANRKTTARTRPQSDVARSVRKPDPKNSTSAWDEGGVGGASVGYVPRQIKPGCEQVQGCETTPGQLHGQKPADLRARRDRRAEVDLKLHVQQAKSTTQVGKPLLFPVPAALWPLALSLSRCQSTLRKDRHMSLLP